MKVAAILNQFDLAVTRDPEVSDGLKVGDILCVGGQPIVDPDSPDVILGYADKLRVRITRLTETLAFAETYRTIPAPTIQQIMRNPSILGEPPQPVEVNVGDPVWKL